MARIFCFGDSVTYGESDIECGGWVERLRRHFLQQQLGHSLQENLVYNLGIAGETTDGLVNRFVAEVTARKSSKSKTIVILSYGYNDITLITDRKGKSKNRVPLEYFIAKIQTCVDSALNDSHLVIINNMVPFASKSDDCENYYGERRRLADIVKYNGALKDIADNSNCHLLDLYSEFVGNSSKLLLASDGLHPNEKGHQLIFERVKDLIDTLLSKA